MNNYLKRALPLAPLFLTALALLFHPEDPGDGKRWTDIHVLLLPLFALSAASLCLLGLDAKRSYRFLIVTLLGVFAVCYTSLDSIAGISAGILAQGHEREAANLLFGSPVKDWIERTAVACFFFASLLIAVHRKKQGSSLVPPVLLVGSALLFALKGHMLPTGPVAFLGLGIANAWFVTSKMALPSKA